LLLNEILPPIFDPLVDTRYHLAPFLPLFSTFSRLGQPALCTGQGLLFLAEEVGILDLFSCGKIRKGL